MAMARVRYTIIRVPAASLEEAHEIIGGMTGLGFPRDRMNVTPHEDDTFHVAIHTREGDRDRVMDALHRARGGVRPTLSTAALMVACGGALLGAALWAWRSGGGWPRLSGQEPEPEHFHSGRPAESSGVGQDGLGSGRFTSREQSQSNIGAHPDGFTGAASRAARANDAARDVRASDSEAATAPAGPPSPNTGFSSANPPRAPSGLSSSLQPGGTLPGGGPGALVGSLGTGGGQTANRDTGSLKRQGH
jgi:hypothetical protein